MPLTIEKQIEELNELLHLDIDAIGAYDEAIEHIKESSMHEPLVKFRGDHQRHVQELSAMVSRLGGRPPTKADFQGMVRKTFTKVAGMIGTESVLKAMKNNEEAINKAYDHHSKLGFPQDVQALIQRNYQDEQRHLEWVNDMLRDRPWESKSAHI